MWLFSSKKDESGDSQFLWGWVSSALLRKSFRFICESEKLNTRLSFQNAQKMIDIRFNSTTEKISRIKHQNSAKIEVNPFSGYVWVNIHMLSQPDKSARKVLWLFSSQRNESGVSRFLLGWCHPWNTTSTKEPKYITNDGENVDFKTEKTVSVLAGGQVCQNGWLDGEKRGKS